MTGPDRLLMAGTRGVAPEFGMQIVLAWIIETLIELAVVTIGYAVARVVLPLISFGRIAVEPVRGSGAPSTCSATAVPTATSKLRHRPRRGSACSPSASRLRSRSARYADNILNKMEGPHPRS